LKAAEQDRSDVANARRRWQVWQRFLGPKHCVFLDGTGTAINMVRRYGRGPSGAPWSRPCRTGL
jgi:hypothetical protein